MADDLGVESADHGYLPSCTASATRRTAPGDWWWQLLASHRDNDMNVNELPINPLPAPITLCGVTGRDFPVYLCGIILSFLFFFFSYVFLFACAVVFFLVFFFFFSCVTSLAEVFSFTCMTPFAGFHVYLCDVIGRGFLVVVFFRLLL